MISLKVRDRHVVALMGRLGNQLFQYSFARWLERETALNVLFDRSMTRNLGLVGTPEFARTVQGRSIPVSRLLPALGGRFPRLAASLRKALGPEQINVDLTASGLVTTCFDRPSWWVGYWQQLVFAEAAREELAGLLGIEPEPRSNGGRIVVHVRRGDYVGLGRQMSSEWYRSAVQHALGVAGDLPVVVVSDDPVWCSEDLSLGVPFSVESGSAIEDFRALAHADFLIASASTFSWWAGFLGGGQVHYPAHAYEDLGTPGNWVPLPA